MSRPANSGFANWDCRSSLPLWGLAASAIIEAGFFRCVDMKSVCSLLVLMLLAGCASTPFTVSSDYDRAIDYSGYETYAWTSENPMVIPEGSTNRPSPLAERRLMDGIERELDMRGFQRVADASQADFVVGFSVGIRDRIDVKSYPTPIGFNTWNYPYGWNYGYAWRSSGMVYGQETRTTQYTEGTLAIDIFDVDNKRPVWHGQAQGVMRDRSPQEQRNIETQAIQEILASFPPL